MDDKGEDKKIREKGDGPQNIREKGYGPENKREKGDENPYNPPLYPFVEFTSWCIIYLEYSISSNQYREKEYATVDFHLNLNI